MQYFFEDESKKEKKTKQINKQEHRNKNKLYLIIDNESGRSHKQCF